MKHAVYILPLIGLLAVFNGCKKQESDEDAVRSGINQHLVSLKTINLSAMNVNVMSVSIQGNQAQAQVEFRPKTGGPPGAGMQVAYTLAKQNGAWVVQTTQPFGGTIQHPGPGDTPNMNSSGPSAGSMPNFRDLVHGGSSPNALPPGHPPVNPQGNTVTQ